MFKGKHTTKLTSILLSNISASYLKLENNYEAYLYSNYSLIYDNNNEKSIYRKVISLTNANKNLDALEFINTIKNPSEEIKILKKKIENILNK
jgi:hypothetical protein